MQREQIDPLFLTTATCELFHVQPAIDVSAEKPYKLIPKQLLLEDIQTRRAISDFQPFKEKITTYNGEEILLAYDAEWQYGQNFYFVFNSELAYQLLNPVKEELKPVVVEKKKREKWQSLGSEKEVEEEQVKPSRPKIELTFQRRQRPRQPLSDLPVQNYVELKPTAEESFKEVKKLELSKGIQSIQETIEQSTQTTWFPKNDFQLQTEPPSLSKEEKESLQKTNEFLDFLIKVEKRFEWPITENQTMNVFENLFDQLEKEDFGLEQGHSSTLQEFQSFTDLKMSKDKSVACIEWHPYIKSVLAMSVSTKLTFEEQVDRNIGKTKKLIGVIYWTFSDAIHPQLYLEAPNDVIKFKTSPTNPNLIAGVCSGGELILWDIKDHQERLAEAKKEDNEFRLANGSFLESKEEVPIVRWFLMSSVENGHRLMATDLQWLPAGIEINYQGAILTNEQSSHSYFICTCSLDGSIHLWDTRQKKEQQQQQQHDVESFWKPAYKLSISSLDGNLDYGLTKLSLLVTSKQPSQSQADLTATTTTVSSLGNKFFVGTEEGDLIYAHFNLEKVEEKFTHVEQILHGHLSTITDLQRSPHYSDILLSVGAWSFHVWKEGLSVPLLTAESPSQYSIGKWSPTRPGVFFVGRQDGALEVWDLYEKSVLPITVQHILPNPIASLTIRQESKQQQQQPIQQQYLALGDDCGTLYVYLVPKYLYRPHKNEKQAVKSFFERESLEKQKFTQLFRSSSKVNAAKKDKQLTTTSAVSDSKEFLNLKGLPELDEKFESLYLKMEENLNPYQISNSAAI